jgi:hypothetical protein
MEATSATSGSTAVSTLPRALETVCLTTSVLRPICGDEIRQSRPGTLGAVLSCRT